MREEKRRRGNEAVWPYIRSRLIQTKKRKHPKPGNHANGPNGQRQRRDTL